MENYGTIPKTITLYSKKHSTIPKTMKFCYTMENNMVLYGKL